jgi:NAD-dependent SIR2 family protein deacetylase
MKNTTENTITGAGISAAQTFSAFRKSRLQSFNRELVAEAFLRDGLSIDLSPTWNNSLFLWEVSATEESGNCEAIASFETEKEGKSFIDGTCLLSEMKEKAEKLSHE